MTTPGAAPRRLRGHPWLTLGTLAVGAMMVSLDSTVVAVAQPAMQDGLRATIGDIQWVTAGYLLSLAALLVVAGKLGDRFGHRRVFLVGTAGFTVSSVAIGLSTHISWVIALRVVQGVFGALMQPPTLALLRVTFPADRLHLPIAIRSSALGIATAAGPVVGGLLVEHFSWQSIFFLNVPIGVMAIGLGTVILREARLDSAAKSSDPVAVVLLSAALLALLWGTVNAPDYGWADIRTWAALAGAVVLGTGFCRWEARAREPLVPMSLFRSPRFSAGVMLMLLVSFVMFGVPFVLTFFLQNMLGMSPMECGIHVLWLTLAMVVAGTATGLVMRRTGPRIPAVSGMAATTVAVFGLTHAVGTGPATGELRVWLVVLGLGFSSVIVATTHLIVGSAPLRHSGVAGGLQQTAMQVGGSLGTAVMGALVAARVDQLLPRRLEGAQVRLSGPELGEAARSVSLGGTPDTLAGSPRVAAELTRIGRDTFVDSLHLALVVSGGLAALGTAAAVVLLRRPARTAEQESRMPAVAGNPQ
ncbi:MFS transporter [Streptomyces sp. RKAG337]|uniref:MFS transporter n=1 Tax=Streptomyces sp. RKAG337 TaxID=2893404 RepID=UPI0020345F87|nr:MFS transporter [Streptomyces sp. RKAG337]MCM2427011.1 MFS transporter [Streptomyces sp. RKAG337]